MKRILVVLALAVVLAGTAAYSFRAPLKTALYDRITANMFVARDDDGYDQGVATGQPLPAIKARYAGHEIATVQPFMGTRGMVLFVNRSVDW